MNILFIDKVHPKLKEELEKAGCICKENYNGTKDQIQEITKGIHGIVIRSRFQIDKNFIDKSKDLIFIARAGAGMENIDLNYAKKKKIKCYNAGEANSQAVAEHALGMILSLFNNITKSNQEICNGIWQREKNRGIELSGKTIGIIGYGNTGSAFSKILEGFGMNILAYDKYKSHFNYESNMDEIYQESDILSLHIPLTKETKHMVNSKFIQKFRKKIYLINTSRGLCLSTKDLVCNLQSGKIRGACLDVLESEKKSFEGLKKNQFSKELRFLIKSKNVILSPHIAGWTKESNVKIANVLLKKMLMNI